MHKIILMVLVGLSSLNSYAMPNSWGYGHNFGQAQFYIENEKRQSLEISCGEDYGRAIYFSYHVDDESIDIHKNGQFSFLFDESIPVIMTNSKEGDSEWLNFNEAISQAGKIQVFRDNQEVATFTPLPYTIQKSIANIKEDCKNLSGF